MNLKYGSPANSISRRMSLSFRAISALLGARLTRGPLFAESVRTSHAARRAARSGHLQPAGRENALGLLFGHVLQPGTRNSGTRPLPSPRAHAGLSTQPFGTLRDRRGAG